MVVLLVRKGRPPKGSRAGKGFSAVVAERTVGIAEDMRFRARVGAHFCCGSDDRLNPRPGRLAGITMSPRWASRWAEGMFRRESNRGCAACRFCKRGRFAPVRAAVWQ